MNQKELEELFEFNQLDSSDGNSERSSLIYAFEDLRGRDYLIQTEGFLDALEKEIYRQLMWYKGNFKIVEESITESITKDVRRLESLT